MHEEKFGESPDAAHTSLGHLLHRAARLMMRGAGHHHGPHHGQARILRMLGQHEAITQRELMDTLQVRSSSLSELLLKLEARGCITRSRDEEDRRGMLIRLAPKGREMIQMHEQEHSALSAHLFASLSESESHQLESILNKLIKAWEQEAPQGMMAHEAGHAHCHGHHHEHGHHHGHDHQHADDTLEETGNCCRRGHGRGRR